MSNYPVIVLDGPDGVGKTTLARGLVRVLGAKYLHLTYRWPKKMFDYHTAALFYVLRESKKHPVILDRWWMSEIAYANVYRQGSKWPLSPRMFEKAALKHAFTYVFCLPDDKTRYLEHYNVLKGVREEMYSDNMDRVWTEFKLIQRSLHERPGIYHYDFMKQGAGLDGVIQAIIAESEDFRQDQTAELLDHRLMNFTGHEATANYILVGDELNLKTRREVWPFFDYSHSSLFMAEQFEKLGLMEHELMFTNVNHKEASRSFELIRRLSKNGSSQVVAMGKIASEKLLQQGIPHKSIKHPQYYRRFQQDGFIQDIKEIVHAHRPQHLLRNQNLADFAQ